MHAHVTKAGEKWRPELAPCGKALGRVCSDRVLSQPEPPWQERLGESQWLTEQRGFLADIEIIFLLQKEES